MKTLMRTAMTDNVNISSGSIKNGKHSFPIRVYYEDTDAGGIVYHSQYLNFMERARTEMLRLCGLEHFAMMTTQISPTLLVVKKISIDFMQSAVLDDLLMVTSEIAKLGAASMKIRQTVMRGAEVLVKAEVKVAVLGGNKKPKKIDPEIRKKIVNTLNI
jgi:acyl-CoA thioester hydrolase